MEQEHDEVGESLIEKRIRRLREEGEMLQKIPFSHRPAMIASSEEARPKEKLLSPIEVTTETAGFDETGAPTIIQETSVTMRDVNTAPFEHLDYCGWLQRSGEPEGIKAIRITVAHRMRSLFEGAAFSGLKAQAYESNGTGGSPQLINDAVIDANKMIGKMRDSVRAEYLDPAVDVVVKDLWLWKGKKGKAAQEEVEKVLRGLDFVAVFFKLVTPEEVRARWPRKEASRAPAAGRGASRPVPAAPR